MTASDLVALYRHLAARFGRNQALFQISLRARDEGWPLEQAVACLADAHARQPVVYISLKPRHDVTMKPYAQWRAPSAVHRGSAEGRPESSPTACARRSYVWGRRIRYGTIEGLQQRGVQPGQVFTYRDAAQILRGLVGQWSIRRALSALDSEGKPIFTLSPRPPTQAIADVEKPKSQSKKCMMIRASEPAKNPRGRPAQRYFTMPEVYELCDRLGVQPSGSDTITEADVSSSSRYREALHREYIKRRPGQYPRSWLASRLGVSVRTEQRYNLAVPIQVQVRYDKMLISWSNLNDIPADFEVKGTFLLDERGKRYPARQEIAASLLAKRHTIIYMRQSMNHYCFGEATSTIRLMPSLFTQRHLASRNTPNSLFHEKLRQFEARVGATWDNPLSAAPEPETGGDSWAGAPIEQKPVSPSPMIQELNPQKRADPLAKPERKAKRHYHKPLADTRMEGLAQQVYVATNTNAGAPAQGMSLYNARRLVDTYGAQPVETTLKRMIWLRQKGKIRSPSGFLVIASRIAWRIAHNATGIGSPAPRFRAEPRRKRRNPLKRG